jgi:hypothetical protein
LKSNTTYFIPFFIWNIKKVRIHFSTFKTNIRNSKIGLSFKIFMSKERYMACEILEVFEDFLARKGIEIPNKERDEYYEDKN